MGVSPREAGRKNLCRQGSGQQETHGRKPSGGRESLKGRKAALGGEQITYREGSQSHAVAAPQRKTHASKQTAAEALTCQGFCGEVHIIRLTR